MQRYFKFKVKHKKICENLTPESVRTVFEDGLFKYYPLRDKNGCRILYIHGGSKFIFSEIERINQKEFSLRTLETISSFYK